MWSRGKLSAKSGSQAHLQTMYILNVFIPALVNLHLYQMGGNSPWYFYETCDSFCSERSFQRRVHSKQPWKVEIMSTSQAEKFIS